MTKQVKRHAKELQSKGRTHTVVELADGLYQVTSGKSGRTYRVAVGAHGQGASCTCDWGKYRPAGTPSGCSHVIAVYDYIAEQDGKRASAWSTEQAAKRQHKAINRDLQSDGLTLTTAKR